MCINVYAVQGIELKVPFINNLLVIRKNTKQNLFHQSFYDYGPRMFGTFLYCVQQKRNTLAKTIVTRFQQLSSKRFFLCIDGRVTDFPILVHEEESCADMIRLSAHPYRVVLLQLGRHNHLTDSYTGDIVTFKKTVQLGRGRSRWCFFLHVVARVTHPRVAHGRTDVGAQVDTFTIRCSIHL